jgi:hypothetical protein
VFSNLLFYTATHHLHTTAAPTSAPLATLKAILFFQLHGVERKDLPDPPIFQRECAAFLGLQIDVVTGWTCTVTQARSRTFPSRRLLVHNNNLLRALQEQQQKPATGPFLEVEMTISGQTSLSQEEFFSLIFETFSDNAESFRSTLASKNSVFVIVESITVSSKALVLPTADDDDEREGMGPGIIVAIVSGALLVALIIGYAACVFKLSRKKRSFPQVPETSRDHLQGNKVTPSANSSSSPPPSPPPPPAPTAQWSTNTEARSAIATPAPSAPVAASVVSADQGASGKGSDSVVSGSDSQDQSFHKSGTSTIAGESEMDTFSVAAGNVDNATTSNNNKSSTAYNDTSASGDELSSHAMSSLRQTMISRTIVAPPGTNHTSNV